MFQQKNMSPIDGLRIFVGALMVYAWWSNGFGLLERFIEPQVEVAVTSFNANQSAENLKFGTGIIPMIVSVIAGVLWLLGLIGILVITLAWHLVESFLRWTLTIILSFFAGGRQLIDGKAASDDASNLKPDPDVDAGPPGGLFSGLVSRAKSKADEGYEARLQQLEATVQRERARLKQTRESLRTAQRAVNSLHASVAPMISHFNLNRDALLGECESEASDIVNRGEEKRSQGEAKPLPSNPFGPISTSDFDGSQQSRGSGNAQD